MVVFTFSILDGKHPFWASLVQKIKIVCLPRLIRISRIQCRCSLFCFRWETSFMSKFHPKNQNCQFKLHFDTYTNSNMQNSTRLFTFSVLYWKHPFWKMKVKEARLLSLQPYGSRDFEIGSCCQHGFFILLR